MTRKKFRLQCAKCPWRKDVDPRDIPNGYCEKRHAGLARTIAMPGDVRGSGSMMACHETPPGKEKPCVGWLVNQLGPGNNIGLRMMAIRGKLDARVRTVGEQHETFEDTLPKDDRDDEIDWGDEEEPGTVWNEEGGYYE